MEMTLRWYGSSFDTVTLKQIRQIPGVTGVITTLYDTAPGEVWSRERIHAMKEEVEANGLHVSGIESVNVHDAIKIGNKDRDLYINNYIETLENLGKEDIHLVCYNFMPVFDWFRTNLYYKHSDGSTSLSYSEEDFKKLDKHNLRLPGWDESYTSEQLNGLLKEYEGITHEKLFENLVYFLKGIMPACNEAGVNMAIHPDDPPWDIFGLPRIVGKESDYDRLFAAVPDMHNGITFCTGSLGAGRFNDLPKMAAKYAKRIYFAHLRQLKFVNETDFYENGHQTSEGNVDIYAIVKALVENGFDGYLRPDHGRNIWGEDAKPGYGLYDRALGAAYLQGVFEAIEKSVKHSS